MLYRRDIAALAGRRRHGKTTFVSNLLVSLTTGRPDFLGYPIPNAVRASVFFLEDDAREIQDKVRRLLNGASTEGRLTIHTREDFYKRHIAIDVGNKRAGAGPSASQTPKARHLRPLSPTYRERASPPVRLLPQRRT